MIKNSGDINKIFQHAGTTWTADMAVGSLMGSHFDETHDWCVARWHDRLRAYIPVATVRARNDVQDIINAIDARQETTP